jgi:hypothetical protein
MEHGSACLPKPFEDCSDGGQQNKVSERSFGMDVTSELDELLTCGNQIVVLSRLGWDVTYEH